MARATKLSEREIIDQIKELEGWTLRSGSLHKTFKFLDFVEAFGFMTQVALLAETMDHHPDWSNGYSRVTIDLITHDAGGISVKDFQLAKGIEALPLSRGKGIPAS